MWILGPGSWIIGSGALAALLHYTLAIIDKVKDKLHNSMTYFKSDYVYHITLSYFQSIARKISNIKKRKLTYFSLVIRRSRAAVLNTVMWNLSERIYQTMSTMH